MPKLSIILPDFVIIGANKAGTTSVANYLNSHPEIKISDVKEPMFFSTDPLKISTSKRKSNLKSPFFTSTLESYSSLYASHSANVKLFGEASTSYLAIPQKSAYLLRKLVPDVKIIVILREPVSRAISAYKMCYGSGVEERSFAEVVKDSISHTSILTGHGVKQYVRNGLYNQLLQEFYRYFAKKQILILNYDKLVADAEGFMSEILAFLKIKEFSFDMRKRYNTEKDNLKENILINESDINILKKTYYNEILELSRNLKNFSLDRWLDYLTDSSGNTTLH